MDSAKVNKEKVKESFDTTSLIDFLKNEDKCDIESIFNEIRSLSSLNNSKMQLDDDEDRPIEEILREAETLINQPIGTDNSISCESTPIEMRQGLLDQYEKSTTIYHMQHDDDASDRTLLNDQLESFDSCPSSPESTSSMKSKKSSKSSGSKNVLKKKKKSPQMSEEQSVPIAVEITQISPEIEKLTIEDFEPDDDDATEKILCDKSTAPSPTHSMISSASFSWARERELESTNENLHEKLKDMEERFHSLRIQYESLSQVHRVLRENHIAVQEESDKLKLDFQILTECSSVLRTELQAAKQDRDSAVEMHKILQAELDENRVDKKKFQEITERDSKTIQDLQRQCREMERILMRKHPDSVSALIVASKNSNNSQPDTSASTRKLLEERIAHLEADAKEQDKKAQGILANVQARFKTVQNKYETHIQDLETQVLSLQQINMEQSKELQEQSHREQKFSQATQTLDIPESESMRTIGTQTNGTSNPPSRAGSAQSITGAKKSTKIPNSQSDSSIHPKDDAHLLATIRGMRIELAIKEKAVQRLTRELEECKKTIRKLQKERDNYLNKEKPTTASAPKKVYNPAQFAENIDSHSLKEAMEKIKSMEMDFKSLYEKRVKDLKTLQIAHERELSACHETIRILQSRLEEHSAMVNASANDKRRGPIDYYALKAKVTSLERRHSEREKSLHLLIDALRLNGVPSSVSPENFPPHPRSPSNKNL